MPLDVARIRKHLKDFDFRALFLDLDWDRPETKSLAVTVEGREVCLSAIAHKRGMVAFLCPASDGEAIPPYPLRRRIEQQVAKSVHEHIVIFTDASQTAQVWQWVKREAGRPVACREHSYHCNQPGDALIQKLQALEVTLEEEEKLTVVDAAGKAKAAFDIERVTKKFYKDFDTHRIAFLETIDGFPPPTKVEGKKKFDSDQEWYASVMLNRLMFVYFIQRKGFLDADRDYLRNRLDRCKKEQGKDKFYSFYRYFLLRLFHEGFGKRRKDRAPDLEKLLGNIPYLNGGLFDVHELEKPERFGKHIAIPDKAFERIFDYFDQYQWHLDERPLRADNEINPDVLGYIFEKYINQKQMGAYYTKEDITEYISKSTVIPFLFDAARVKCKVAFENPDGPTVWDLLCENPDRYIYPAVRHGADKNLPPEIAAGLERSEGILPSFANPNPQGQDAHSPFLNPFENIEQHRTNLPHWQQHEAWQFVTWRLADSLPKVKLDEWQSEKDAWLAQHPQPWDDSTHREYHELFSARINHWLDAGHGACILKDPACSRIVADALRHFDGQRYTLGPFIVMPNHVHVLFRPSEVHALENIIHSWKSFSANQLNKLIGSKGTLWQNDYWDTMIRHERHWHACRQYILKNSENLLPGMFERSEGILPSFANPNPQGQDALAPLIERRKAWNKPAPGDYGLPTEIWREVVARRQRYEEIKRKLAAGEVREINDFITLNLDLRQFAQDVIQNSEGPDLLMAFWNAITTITVLDPTGGSGAFIFAALNILEPLYEACLDRMEAFLAEWKRSEGILPSTSKNQGQDAPAPLRLSNYHNRFTEVLARVDVHTNRRYFILKSIILNNLYAVDIMEEAVEICKLRLFLKLAAQVEPDNTKDNLGIDPLPDIDFNIRAGNTLVGYATADEVRRSMKESDGGQKKLMYEEEQTAFDRFNIRCADVDQAFTKFRQLQTEGDGSVPAADKLELQKRLKALEDELNCYLAGEYGIGSVGVSPASSKASGQDARAPLSPYAKWEKSHQPFHWFIQFHDILNSGGFDVIIGNPPYLEIREIDYGLKNYACFDSGAIHAMCMERSERLLHKNGCMSMIVPLSLPSTQRMEVVQKLLEEGRNAWFANYAWRPAKLFDTVNRALTIFVVNPSGNGHTFSTNYQKWTSDDRDGLMERLNYVEVQRKRPACWIPKVGNFLEQNILNKYLAVKTAVKRFATKSEHRVYYRTTGGLYWKVFTDFAPAFNLNGKKGHSSRETWFTLGKKEYVKSVIAALSSDVFWWWYTVTSNVRDLNPFDIQNFPLPESALADPSLQALGARYLRDLDKNSTMLVREQKQTGTTETQSFKIQKSKPIIDEIDTVLAKHYGFTAEELDFILNYDIKYRLGRNTGEEE